MFVRRTPCLVATALPLALGLGCGGPRERETVPALDPKNEVGAVAPPGGSPTASLLVIGEVGAEPWDESFARRAPSGAAVFVAATGTDAAGCGGEQAPCATIASAIEHADPGAVILVEGSETPYAERVVLTTRLAGTSEAPHTLRGIPDALGNLPRFVPVRDPVSGAVASPIYVHSSYWILDGLRVDCEGEDVPGMYLVGSDHVAITNSEVFGCGDGVEVRASSHVLIERATLKDNVQQAEDGSRRDANGVTINSGSSHVTVRDSVLSGNSGDAIQCQGREQEPTDDPALNSRHIRIQNNEAHDDLENAVDIKSCERVSIVGNDFHGYEAAEGNGGQCGGVAVIAHYAASGLLIEGNWIHDSGSGIEIGNEYYLTRDVLIRRNQLSGTNQDATPTTSGDRYNCGDGITVKRAERVEIHNNTLDRIAHSGIRVGANLWYATENADCEDNLDSGAPCTFGKVSQARVWNNLVTNVAGTPHPFDDNHFGGALEYGVTNVEGLFSDRNLIFNADSATRLVQVSGHPTALVRIGLSGLAEWTEATGLDSSSVSFDPGYAPGELTLAPNSPARDLGMNDATLEDEGCGASPDLGAIESDCD